LGLTPAQIAPYVINKTGAKAGKHLMLTGVNLGGNAAQGVGLVDALADDDANPAIERAQQLESRFTADHPVAARIAREIADLLAKMGI